MMGGRARAKIRAPRRALATNDAVDFDSQWKVLSSSLREIHTKNASNLSFEVLYRHAYLLVLKKKGDELYDKVQELQREWLQTEVRSQILAVLSPSLLVESANGSSGVAENANEKRAAGERLMKALRQAWEDYILCMGMTTDVLMYMDRIYCDQSKLGVFEAAMSLFRDCILLTTLPGHDDLTIKDILYEVILSQIQMEREGDVIDRALIRSCVYMLEGLYKDETQDDSSKLYLTSFEPAFLAASEVFYQNEGQRLLREVDAGTFCRHTMRRINEESDRCRSTLSPLTLTKIKAVIDMELIRDCMQQVIGLPGSGVKFMLDNDRYEELALIYDLVSRVDPRKEDLKNAAQKRILEMGETINQAAIATSQAPPPKLGSATTAAANKNKGKENAQAEKDSLAATEQKSTNPQTTAAIEWVDAVLRLKDKYDKVLSVALRDDQTMQTAVTRSFSEFINAFNRSSEYLSLFFDENMKKGIKGKTENEVDSLLDKGITLLRYIQDKDMFERYYKRHLSRRLLMKRSVSMDAERQMISKMKMEVGNTFTQRIEAMFKDMAISEDLSRGYKEHVESLGDVDRKRAELEVNVLTSTMWPLEAMGSTSSTVTSSSSGGGIDGGETGIAGGAAMCIFPPAIDRLRRGFERFYLDKHSGRKLTWQCSMGTADIRAHFPRTKSSNKFRELNVSTYAMIVLLLFNDLDPPESSLTVEEIQAKTNIPLHDLTRNLQSLAVASKTRVLTKEPHSREIKPGDRFFFNEEFYSQYTKIKIGVVANSQTNRPEDAAEREQTEKKNNDARAAIIEAAIVRIMKQRKQLVHSHLITEVISQLNSRFMPDVGMVKKRIESLIEREYLERVEDSNWPEYRYLA